MENNNPFDKISYSATVVRKLIAGQSVNGHIAKLDPKWREIAEAVASCPPNPQERTRAFETAITGLPDSIQIRERVFAADLNLDLDGFESKAQDPLTSLDIPRLPSAAQIPESLGNGACPWLDNYIHFSRRWAPRAYDGFHEACGLFVLSTTAARRVLVNLGKQRFTNLFIALVSRTSLYTKTTTADIALQVLQKAGLTWLLAPDSSTPQKFLSDMANRTIQGYDLMNEEQKNFAKLRAAMAGQKGWYYEEFGQQVAAMMKEGGFMSDFRGILRRFDDTPDRYENATISRGNDIIEQVYLALLASMTPDDLRPFARKGSSLWGDGFLARYALITPSDEGFRPGRFPPGERIIPTELLVPLHDWHYRLGIPDVQIDDVPNKDGSSSGLKKVSFSPINPTVLTLGYGVEDAFYAYYDGLLEIIQKSDNDDLDGNNARMAEKALRVSILLASISGQNTIELKHWALAQAITERWRAGLYELYSQINQPPSSRNREKEDAVLRILKKHGSVTAAQVTRFARNLSTSEAAQILDGLVEADVLTVNRATKKGTKEYAYADECES